MERVRFASALSTAATPKLAIDETVQAIRTALDGERPDLVSVFASHHFGAALEGLGPTLAETLKAGTLIGCTGESIVGPDREIERGPALSVLAGVLPRTDVRPFVVQMRPVQPRPRERETGDEDDDESTTYAFSAMPDVVDATRSSILLLADPFTFPPREFLEILNEKYPGLPVVGGMSSGGNGPGQNHLITDRGLVDGGAIGVVIDGDVEVCPVVSQGCRPVGKPFVITACRENMIQKLGGKPALTALVTMMESLDETDRKLLGNGPFIGLAVDPTKSSFARADFIVRGIVGLEKNLGAIVVGDDSIRVGQTIHFLVRDADSAGEDLSHLMRESAHDADRKTLGALVFTCNGRGTRMFSRPNHDITRIQAALDEHVPAAGFFALGELGPVGGKNFVHGFTASVALFRPRR